MNSTLEPIYLDYNATTPVDPRVVEAMSPYFSERFGNASSTHVYGYEAHEAMDQARERVGALLGGGLQEIVFTGGGSESDNLAIKGVVFSNLSRAPHVVTSATEHPAVLNSLAYLKRRFGVGVTLVHVDGTGLVDPDSVRHAIRPETVLVSVMHANNETGTIQPIRELAAVAHEHDVLFHTDAAQSTGKVTLDVRDLGVDLLTLAGHKVYSPKGIGALYVRAGVQLDPLVHGSSQEGGLRAGTENVALMVALGMAAQLAQVDLPDAEPRLRLLRGALYDALAERIPGLLLNGHPTRRLPNTLNVSLPGVVGQTVLEWAPEVAAATGAACHSGSPDPSGVLMAMGLPTVRALGALRLSVGRWSTPEEMQLAAEALAAAYRRASGRTAAATG